MQALYMHTPNNGKYMPLSSVALQVKELLSRNLDAYEIAHRLHIDIGLVQQAIIILTQTS